MIICFSGTGNSRMVAEHLQAMLGDDLVRLQPGLLQDPTLAKFTVDDGRIIWVVPVYCWGLPKVISNVIKLATISSDMPVTHHLVCTCGDDVGMTDRIWRKLINKRGWRAGSAFSVQMPNTFVFLPGFDVDTPEVAQAKLESAPKRVKEIAHKIDEGTDNETDVVRGACPYIKSYLIRPWFNKYYISEKKFTTTDICGGCGKCSRACPMNLIIMENGRPKWTSPDLCTLCSRCYHYCPKTAVRYGHFSNGKGKYMCPK